ncbi:MAG: hypothetical protein ACI4XF_08395 [Oscillospiraceae bacterium]
MDAASKALRDIFEALESAKKEESDVSTDTLNDLLSAIIAEPSRKKRQRLIKDFTARHKDAADFLAQNEELINAEAEAALIRAAVGGTHTEREISYKGGRKSVKTKRITTQPNMAALGMLLKNRMPDKYSDDPQGEIEIEDVSGVKEDIENAEEVAAEDEGG